MVILTLLVAPLVLDGAVNRLDGLILTALLAAYLAFVFLGVKKAPAPLISGISQLTEGVESRTKMAILGDFGLLAAGTAGLVLGGRAIVEAGTFLSREFGVSDSLPAFNLAGLD